MKNWLICHNLFFYNKKQQKRVKHVILQGGKAAITKMTDKGKYLISFFNLSVLQLWLLVGRKLVGYVT